MSILPEQEDIRKFQDTLYSVRKGLHIIQQNQIAIADALGKLVGKDSVETISKKTAEQYNKNRDKILKSLMEIPKELK